jgi:hypothetical protein
LCDEIVQIRADQPCISTRAGLEFVGDDVAVDIWSPAPSGSDGAHGD